MAAGSGNVPVLAVMLLAHDVAMHCVLPRARPTGAVVKPDLLVDADTHSQRQEYVHKQR